MTHAAPISDSPIVSLQLMGKMGFLFHEGRQSLPGREAWREDSSMERWMDAWFLHPAMQEAHHHQVPFGLKPL